MIISKETGKSLRDLIDITDTIFTTENIELNIELLQSKSAERKYKFILDNALNENVDNVYKSSEE